MASIIVVEEAGGIVAEVLGRELCVLDHQARSASAVAATPQLSAVVLTQRGSQQT